MKNVIVFCCLNIFATARFWQNDALQMKHWSLGSLTLSTCNSIKARAWMHQGKTTQWLVGRNSLLDRVFLDFFSSLYYYRFVIGNRQFTSWQGADCSLMEQPRTRGHENVKNAPLYFIDTSLLPIYHDCLGLVTLTSVGWDDKLRSSVWRTSSTHLIKILQSLCANPKIVETYRHQHASMFSKREMEMMRQWQHW
jgi:hypothetical protein